MAKIIEFKKRNVTGPDNLITSRPWEFRRADWESKYFVQILRSHWKGHRSERKWCLDVLPHFVLKDSMAYTIHGIYNYRNNIENMREVYYLAGLIDCIINQINPLLRTDLIKDIYNKIKTIQGILNINWHGHMDQVLFPIDEKFFNHHEYRERLSKTATMKELYHQVREGTDKMFDILSSEYIFFTPGGGYEIGA